MGWDVRMGGGFFSRKTPKTNAKRIWRGFGEEFSRSAAKYLGSSPDSCRGLRFCVAFALISIGFQPDFIKNQQNQQKMRGISSTFNGVGGEVSEGPKKSANSFARFPVLLC